MLQAKRLLHRVQGAVGGGHTLDGGDRRAFGLHRQDVAAFDHPTVEMDGAGTALGSVATDMGAGQAQHIANEIDQQGALLDFVADRLAIDLH